MLEIWTKSNEAFLKGTLDLAQEVVGFSQARFQASVEAATTLSACRNPEEFISCQQKFLEAASKEYLDEVNRLTTRVGDLLNGAASFFRDQATKS